MRTGLVLTGFVAIALIGCKENTTCTIGNALCLDNQAKQCMGTEGGGDDDGEFVVTEDCKGQGSVCREDFVLGKAYVGCVSQDCAATNRVQCFALGVSQCSLLNRVLVCTRDGNGCQTYATADDCEKLGATCVENDQGGYCEK